MVFDILTLKLAIGRLMMQVEEEQHLREDIISGSVKNWKPEIPTAERIDQKILDLTGDFR